MRERRTEALRAAVASPGKRSAAHTTGLSGCQRPESISDSVSNEHVRAQQINKILQFSDKSQTPPTPNYTCSAILHPCLPTLPAMPMNEIHAPPSIHPTAVVDEGAQIGAGTRIWHWVHVSGGAVIGKNCSLGQNVFVGNRGVLGNNVRIQNNVSIYDDVTLEDDVFCGPSMVFTNVMNPRAHVSRKHEYRKTLVRRGASIGANATIVCGVEIGRYAMIGAGAVVTHDVPAHALMTGVPARRRGWICQCGVKLLTADETAEAPGFSDRIEVNCSECNTAYRISATRCDPVQPT